MKDYGTNICVGVVDLHPPSPKLTRPGACIRIFERIWELYNMHGAPNFTQFPNGLGSDVSIGENISQIYNSYSLCLHLHSGF